jgi:hypothetical protein
MPNKRTIEGAIRHRETTNAYRRRKRLDPAFRAAEAITAHARYERDKDQRREYAREWQSKHKEEVNERRKKVRRGNPESARAKDKQWRANGVRAYFAKFRRGDIGVSEFADRIGKAYIRHDEGDKR